MKTSRAFTLIEIMIALFIFAIMSAIISTVLYTVFNSREDSQQFAKKLNEMQLAITIIENDIEQIIAKSIRSEKKYRIPALLGDSNKIEFTRTGFTNPQFQLERTQLQRVEYLLEDSKLIRQTWDTLDRDTNTKTSRRILLNNIIEMKIDYLSAKQKFYNEWPSGSALRTNSSNRTSYLLALPNAVRINLIIKNWGELPLLFAVPAGTIL